MTVEQTDRDVVEAVFGELVVGNEKRAFEVAARHRIAAEQRGREAERAETLALVARALRLYPEWCKNWGLDRNMAVATEAANECADMLAFLPNTLPEDDDEAAAAIYKTFPSWIEAQAKAIEARQHKPA